MKKQLIGLGVTVLMLSGVGIANATLMTTNDLVTDTISAPILSKETESFPSPELSFELSGLASLPKLSFKPFVAKPQTWTTYSFTLWACSPPSPLPYTAYEPDKAPVPEPATMLLFGTGLVGLVGSRLKKKKKL